MSSAPQKTIKKPRSKKSSQTSKTQKKDNLSREDMVKLVLGEDANSQDTTKQLPEQKIVKSQKKDAPSREELVKLLLGEEVDTQEANTQEANTQEANTQDENKQASKQKPVSDSDKKRLDLVAMLSGESKDSINPSQLKTTNKDSSTQDTSDQSNNSEFKSNDSFDKKKALGLLQELVLTVCKDQDEIDVFLSDVANRYQGKHQQIQGVRGSISENKNLKKRTTNDVFLMHWNGRFGNRMHTYAYLYNRAKKLNGEFFLPSDWEGKYLFNLDYKIISDEEFRNRINQTDKQFDTFDFRMDAVKDFNNRTDYNLRYANPDDPNDSYKKYNQGVVIDSVCAYHPEIFKHMKLSDVLKLYEFNDEVKNLDVYKMLEDKQGTYDIAHLRRDDISDINYPSNGGYSTISKESYLKAFKKYGYDPDKIEWTTDDWSGKWGVQNSRQSGLIKEFSSWRYPEGTGLVSGIIFDWLPDFLRLYFARTVFRANSSFSFWACTLAKGREQKQDVFAPRLDKRILYRETKKETHFEFERGNHPHWLCVLGNDPCPDIVFSDEMKNAPKDVVKRLRSRK